MRRNISIIMAMLIILVTMATLPTGKAITWTTETQLTSEYHYDGLVSGAQSKDGLVWVVWQSDRMFTYDIFYKTYNGAGWTVDAPLVANFTANDIDPFLFQNSNGTLFLFFSSDRGWDPNTGKTNYDLFYMASNNNGATWPYWPKQLTSTLDDDFSPYVCQTNDGSIWVFWYRLLPGNYEIFYKKYSSQTNSWSDEIQFTFNPAPDKMPSIAQASNGTLVVFWQTYRLSNFDVYYALSSNNGASWSDAIRFTTSTDVDGDPAVYRTIEGVLYVVWSARPSSPQGYNDVYYATSYSNGVTWSSPIAIVTDSYDDTFPGIFQSLDRKIWIVWSTNRVGQPDGNLELFYKTTVPLLGDANGDWIVDAFDFALFGRAWGTSTGDPAYSLACDFNSDGHIDAWDLAIFAKNYGLSG